jgi:hypothetical protein
MSKILRSGVYTVVEGEKRDVVYDISDVEFWGWIEERLIRAGRVNGSIEYPEVELTEQDRYEILLLFGNNGGKYYRDKKEWEAFSREL